MNKDKEKRREYEREYMRAYRQKHGEKLRTDQRRRYKENIEHYRAFNGQTRLKIIELLGGMCIRCGFSDIRALQLDHIGGGGTKEINTFTSREAYYRSVLSKGAEGFQVLCANCNWIKRAENGECHLD